MLFRSRYLDKVAEETGTVIYLEPLNRYQDHMINLLADARHYIDSNQIGRASCRERV